MPTHFTESKPPATAEMLHEIEQKIGCALPEQYKEFLLQHNGGRPKPSCFKIEWRDQKDVLGRNWEEDSIDFFLSINEHGSSDFLDYHDTFKDTIPDDVIPIAYDPGGNLIFIGTGKTNNGQIFFGFLHGNAPEDEDEHPKRLPLGFVASSFSEFLDGLYGCE